MSNIALLNFSFVRVAYTLFLRLTFLDWIVGPFFMLIDTKHIEWRESVGFDCAGLSK